MLANTKRITVIVVALALVLGGLAVLSIGAPTAHAALLTTPELGDAYFTNVLTSQIVDTQQAIALPAGPYTLQVPQGAFSEPVRITLYSADPAAFAGMSPRDGAPVLAFDLRVTNPKTGETITQSNEPLTLTVTDYTITLGSQFEQLTADGQLTPVVSGVHTTLGAMQITLSQPDSVGVITMPSVEDFAYLANIQ
jgi:hypothetical protein